MRVLSTRPGGILPRRERDILAGTEGKSGNPTSTLTIRKGEEGVPRPSPRRQHPLAALLGPPLTPIGGPQPPQRVLKVCERLREMVRAAPKCECETSAPPLVRKGAVRTSGKGVPDPQPTRTIRNTRSEAPKRRQGHFPKVAMGEREAQANARQPPPPGHSPLATENHGIGALTETTGCIQAETDCPRGKKRLEPPPQEERGLQRKRKTRPRIEEVKRLPTARAATKDFPCRTLRYFDGAAFDNPHALRTTKANPRAASECSDPEE